MLKIRLRRMGAIRQPHYRIVVADSRSPRDGRFIEALGHYNPLTDPATIQIDVDKYEAWKQKGAQPTHAVVSLVRQFNQSARMASEQPATKQAPKGAKRTPETPSATEPGIAEGALPVGEDSAEAATHETEDSGVIAEPAALAAAADSTDMPVLEAAAEPAAEPSETAG